MVTDKVASVPEPVTNALTERAPVMEPAEKPEKVMKEKKPRVPKSPTTHPSFLQMIKEAIAFRMERTGSSQSAIVKYLEDKYKSGLPPNFKKTLSVHLKELTKRGKLTKEKYSFTLSKKLQKLPTANVPKSSKTVKTINLAKGSTNEVKKTAGRPKTVVKRKSANGVASSKVGKKAAKTTKGTKLGTKVKRAKASKRAMAPAKGKVSTRKKPAMRKVPASRKIALSGRRRTKLG